jgi:ABC-type nickel/cobalt efflux system permease component RcnA
VSARVLLALLIVAVVALEIIVIFRRADSERPSHPIRRIPTWLSVVLTLLGLYVGMFGLLMSLCGGIMVNGASTDGALYMLLGLALIVGGIGALVMRHDKLANRREDTDL